MEKMSTFDIWLEEYNAIAKDQMDNGPSENNARRLLIFTEGFMHKVTNTDIEELTPNDMSVLMQLREKNMMMLPAKEKKRLEKEWRDKSNEHQRNNRS